MKYEIEALKMIEMKSFSQNLKKKSKYLKIMEYWRDMGMHVIEQKISENENDRKFTPF